MNSVLRELVELGAGLVTRGAAGQVVPSWTLRQACRNGELVRVLPEVFVAAHLVGGRPGAPALSRLDPALSLRAALAWAGGDGALSHLSALAVWGLRSEEVGDLVHLSTPASASLRSRPGVIVHRRRGLSIEPPQVVVRRSMMAIVCAVCWTLPRHWGFLDRGGALCHT
ncbi:hypothetical protein [Micromonospora violae]|uniref:hypothetical protein n=1 Tax=Micromonospora violae TaxID=1278207 RepID=UPI001ABFD97F|nr:hypothetical protein [Micromonospora violae]